MEEKIDRIEKAVEQNTRSINDLIEIVVAIKDNMVTKDEFFAFEVKTEERFEGIDGKLGGIQRSLDAGFERQSGMETRITKVEAELRMQ